MDKTEIYIVNTFTDKLFEGNLAGVCPLKKWLPDSVMQSIALENNLSETAFFVIDDDIAHIRWFTPKVEVKLCGHATLASAYILFNELSYKKEKIIFNTFFGEKIKIFKENNIYFMDFPAYKTEQSNLDLETIKNALGMKPYNFLSGFYGLAIFKNEEEIISISPKFSLLKKLPIKGIIATAPGKTLISFLVFLHQTSE